MNTLLQFFFGIGGISGLASIAWLIADWAKRGEQANQLAIRMGLLEARYIDTPTARSGGSVNEIYVAESRYRWKARKVGQGFEVILIEPVGPPAPSDASNSSHGSQSPPRAKDSG